MLSRQAEEDHAEQFDPIELVVVQATSFCNLNCQYCYLSEETRKTKDRIALSKISIYFSKILSSQYLGDRLIISWHSGEPLVLGTTYYEAVIERVSELAEEFRGADFKVLHDFQTNGTLIDDDWCAFFNKYRDSVTVGVSCDGPDDMHDVYRHDWKGSGTFAKTLRGIERLVENDIKFSLIAVISPRTLEYPDEFFDFFCSFRPHISEFRFNLLDEFSESGEFSYRDSRDSYYAFLKSILDKLVSLGSEDELLNIKNFSYFYDRLFSPPADRWKQTADHMSRPFRAFNIATNGDVSTFYAGVTIDECADIYGDGMGLVLGNLNDQSLDEIAKSRKLAKLSQDFRRSHAVCQETCPYFQLCPGGYNLIKFKRHGTFDVAETPECRIQVQTFADALIDHMKESITT
jgi:uncharacterized protein